MSIVSEAAKKMASSDIKWPLLTWWSRGLFRAAIPRETAPLSSAADIPKPSKSSVILTPIYWLLGVIYRHFEYLSDWFSSLLLRKNEAISGYPHVSTISGSSPQSPSKPPGDAPWPLCRCVLSVISPWIHHRTHHGLGASPTRKALAGNHEERVTQLWWLTLW